MQAANQTQERGDVITQMFADQIQSEVLHAEQSSPQHVADMAEQATRQPAICTIDDLEERRRLATLAIQTLNNHTQAEDKAKNASVGSIFGEYCPLLGPYFAAATNPYYA